MLMPMKLKRLVSFSIRKSIDSLYTTCGCSKSMYFVLQLPISMEEIVDLLNDVNQQLGDSGEAMDEEDEKELEARLGPTHSSPAHPSEISASISHIKFSTPSPNKSTISPSKRHLVGVFGANQPKCEKSSIYSI